MNTNEITLNGVTYVKKDTVQGISPAEELDGMKFCIVRTYSAGVFAGYVEKKNGKEVSIRNAIRIWYWDGAASLSQLAVDGTLKPDKCKFACVVNRIEVTEAIEIIECTQKAKESIEGVPSWVMKK